MNNNLETNTEKLWIGWHLNFFVVVTVEFCCRCCFFRTIFSSSMFFCVIGVGYYCYRWYIHWSTMAYTYKKLSIHLESDIFWGNGQKKSVRVGMWVCVVHKARFTQWIFGWTKILYMNKLDVILIFYKSMNDKIHRNAKHIKNSFTSPTEIIANDFDPSIWAESKKKIFSTKCTEKHGYALFMEVKKNFAKQAARFICFFPLVFFEMRVDTFFYSSKYKVILVQKKSSYTI